MEEALLADKYAKALIACAKQADLIDQLDVELALFLGMLKKQPTLSQVLLSPLISFKEKAKLLQATFKGQWVSPELQSFLLLLLKMNRLHLFGQICRTYEDLIYSLRKRLKVFVECAFPLNQKQKKMLKSRLTKIYQRSIDLSLRLNPLLIGGARVCVGHTLFDGTVRARLELLREQLWKA